MGKTLYLIRHGDTGEDNHGRFVGSTDVPLSALGRRQAESLADVMAALAPNRVLCSPMLRARETADIALRPSGLGYEVNPDLREVDFGQWECRTFDEIAHLWPAEVDRWAAFDSDFAFPGGESFSSFFSRVELAAGILLALPDEAVAVVTHGGVIRALICALLGMERHNYLVFEVDKASVSAMKLFETNGILSSLNDCCHLRGCETDG